MREKYDADKEWQVIGSYPPARAAFPPGFQFPDKGPLPPGMPPSPKFNRPVTPIENFLMFFNRETPYWIPEVGWFNCDLVQFRPRQHPDNYANHQCIDGGDSINWRKTPKVVRGWFELPLEFEPMSGGATVRPGSPMMPEIYGWEEKLLFPDLEKDIDWEEMKSMNSEYCFTDKPTQIGLQFGLWERMMNLMGVDNAAIALLDPDQQEEIKRFLDKLSDLYIDYLGKVLQVCRIDAIHFHDDWGTHNGPFFSLDTAMEFFVPPMRKVVEYCHKNGIIFEHHCCGNAGALVPAMIETGSDFWNPQSAINDVDGLNERYGDRYVFAAHSPLLKKGISKEDVKDAARSFVDKYKDRHMVFIQDTIHRVNPEYDSSLYPVFTRYVYEFSRKAYS